MFLARAYALPSAPELLPRLEGDAACRLEREQGELPLVEAS